MTLALFIPDALNFGFLGDRKLTAQPIGLTGAER